MTVPPRLVWGFCEACERWRLSAAWGDPPACPECGTPPRPLESWADGTGRLTLILELPPGSMHRVPAPLRDGPAATQRAAEHGDQAR